jgi:undecaprenyl diphosphate synthase
MTQQSNLEVPTHIGIILDGNRRWAKEHDLTTFEGHKIGCDNLKGIAEHAFSVGVSFLTAFIFSTENWNRAKEEVDYLMGLGVRLATKDAAELAKNNVKIVFLGGIDDQSVPKKVVTAFKKVEEDSKNNTGGTLALCFNYGGKQELADAMKQIKALDIPVEEITQETISQHLYHPEIPPLDLLLRTSGEQRISNFMLWRAAYAELFFVPKHWPEFKNEDLDTVIAEYQKRNRRFGGN